jgi:Zn-dependent peptidase ImmA (M78 family)
MSDDFRVNRRSDHQVRDRAYSTKAAYKTANRRPVNIISCLQSGWVPTERGNKKLIFKVVNDAELGGDDGLTEFKGNEVTITVKRSIFELARVGDGRSRMTLAHELGHAVMHYGEAKHRGTGVFGPTALSRISPEESAEHQAKVFGSAFLIDDKVAAELGDAVEVSVEFGVSLTAAKICLERLAYEAERAESAARVQQMSEDVKVKLLGSAQKDRPNYVDGTCLGCGSKTVIPLGNKLLCDTCGHISDQLPDGDS